MKKITVNFLLALVAGSIVSLEVSAQGLANRLDTVSDKAIVARDLPGMTVAVQFGESFSFVKGYGYADLENSIEATQETVYRVGSISKQFTAASILKLVSEKSLNLSDPITKHVPMIANLNSEISIHQLLTHTSGVEEYVSLLGDQIRLSTSPAQIVDLFASKPLLFAPGTQWRYSNSGYYLLGLAIESASGMDYSSYVKEELTRPLNLRSTHYCNDSKIVENRASGYKRTDSGFLNADPIDMSVPFSAGGLCSTALDLISWSRKLFQGSVVTAEMLARMVSPESLVESTYGYGLHIEELKGRTRFSHDGGINGYTTFLAHYPEQEVTIAVMTNLQEAPVEAISLELADEIFSD